MPKDRNQQLAALANHGFGVYNIAGGKLEPDARYAVADPADDEDGFYLEGAHLQEVVDEAIEHFELTV